jgi:hypothetical protein
LIPFGGDRHVRPVIVPIRQLAAAFQFATERFFRAIETDPELERRVWSRADSYFDEVIAHGEPMTENSWVETVPPDFGFDDGGEENA